MVNDLSGIDDLELMPLGGGYMVRRERLMNELIAKGRKAGIVVLYAPDGFGKTSVLLQYTHEVKCDPTRGPVRIIEADRAIGREVFMQLEVVTEELKDKPHSLIAIDNVPNLDQHDTEDLIDRIRGLRAMGVGVFISCRPSNRQLIHGWAIRLRSMRRCSRCMPMSIRRGHRRFRSAHRSTSISSRRACPSSFRHCRQVCMAKAT